LPAFVINLEAALQVNVSVGGSPDFQQSAFVNLFPIF